VHADVAMTSQGQLRIGFSSPHKKEAGISAGLFLFPYCFHHASGVTGSDGEILWLAQWII